MKKYIIFDLDGTLIKSMDDIIDTIVSYLAKKTGEDFEQKIRYVIGTTKGTPLITQLKMILGERHDLDEIKKNIYEIIESNEMKFFPGTQAKIKDLQENYTLFLSTANSTKAAKKILEKGEISDCFREILGSESILKGPEHIKIFQEHSGDEDFFESAIYIGDGDRDREIAMKFKIDFIHIGNDNIDLYEVPSIKYISPILDELNHKIQWNYTQ